jgi:glycosyltransferase involved in cell wall biosynthesis
MASPTPKVSVIIPVYNVTPYIAAALDSLRAQTFRDFETVVVNDGCPDTANLERILQPFRNEIVYIKQENAGVAAARNTAIRAARGAFIALLDPDDIWEPDYLKIQTGILEANAAFDLVYPDAVFFGDTPWEGRTIMEVFPTTGEVTFEKLASLECRVFVGVTARRDVLVRAGLFDTSLPSAEDFDLWLRLARMGARFTYHTQRLVRYRSRRDSLSHDSVSLARSVLRVYKKLLQLPDLTARERGLFEDLCRRQEADLEFFLGKKALYAGRNGEAARHIATANRVMHKRKLSVLLFAIRFAPGLLQRYIHRRHPTEFSFMH